MSQDKDFRLNLQITKKERSKDSNSTNEKWTIKDGVLSHSLSFSGRRGPNQTDSQSQHTLSEQEIETIKLLISEKNLYQNIPSPKYSEFAVPYVATEVSFTVNKKEESYRIQLYDLSSHISKNEVYQRINSLKELLKAL